MITVCYADQLCLELEDIRDRLLPLGTSAP